MNQPYHHGNLHKAVLDRAAQVIEAEGPYAFSLRSLASDLGVSHTAPRHHFGSREGVLNAMAAQGFGWLADSLRRSRESGGTFLDLGVTYVEFALAHPAHFQVMFTPTLLDESHAELHAARDRAFGELTGGADELVRERLTDDAASAIIAGWSMMHGLATLAMTGNLDSAGVRDLLAQKDVSVIARRSARMLFGGAGRPEPDGAAPSTNGAGSNGASDNGASIQPAPANGIRGS